QQCNYVSRFKWNDASPSFCEMAGCSFPATEKDDVCSIQLSVNQFVIYELNIICVRTHKDNFVLQFETFANQKDNFK
ncbi:MAG: hypothetical protein K0Q56_2160, partial [Sporolactobacillus laevolacticus]|nr:hypothetical protein [Sporolactobacillus laevolacticus]